MVYLTIRLKASLRYQQVTAGYSLVANPQETGFTLRDDRIATAVYRGSGQVGHICQVYKI